MDRLEDGFVHGDLAQVVFGQRPHHYAADVGVEYVAGEAVVEQGLAVFSLVEIGDADEELDRVLEPFATRDSERDFRSAPVGEEALHFGVGEACEFFLV